VPLTPNGGGERRRLRRITGRWSATEDDEPEIGGVINISGTNLASVGTASQLPAAYGVGWVVRTFNDVALPLLQTASGQIQGQNSVDGYGGANVVQFGRWLQGSRVAVVVTVQTPTGTGGSTNSGSTAVDEGRGNNRIIPKHGQ